ncbi:Putative UDP-glucuronate\\x3axylan alpha-glucuronosyltransferase 4 [Striga hermonthica]|uniref:Hexosyltransferase n=1 Tax=Striga hermonthica TaxID=68872 RepID=A0A9N7NFD1_STRHE|nr:Putative UDP-glucuronate\\x3axylan alpha-glucuronosyltransferase 4 [Striga hermonthica]
MITTNLFSFSLITFSLTLLFLTTLHNDKLHDPEENRSAHHESLQKHLSRRSSAKTPGWYQVIARRTNGRKKLKVGRIRLTNTSSAFENREYLYGDTIEMIDIQVQRVSRDVRWADLFPEWIDESLPWDSPDQCPHIPMPEFEDYNIDLDVVMAEAPCGETVKTRIGRDFGHVLRLQINLVVANMLVKSGRRMWAVFVGSCGPMSEIFRCDDLIWHEGDYWIYKPDLGRLKQKLRMPVGSCQLAPAFPEQKVNNRARREAYVTVLHSSEDYVCGALALAQSILNSNSTRDLVLLADHSITPKSRLGLRAAGWKIRHIKRIRNPHTQTETYNEWNYSKLRIWQLTDYDKLIFIDSDFLILKNTDKFFAHPQLSAAGNSRHLFNSGFMLVEPSVCTFRAFMRQRAEVASYNGGDQGFLNEVVTWWHRWPAKVNFLKDFGPDEGTHEEIPDDVYALHYLGFKPWMCRGKERDCNWDVPENRRFASDKAHRMWWRVFEGMADELRDLCVITPEMEGRMELHIAKG